MNARPQITIVEPRIRTPAWRSASPKKRKTRPAKTCADDARAELGDVAEGGDPVLRDADSQVLAHYLITEISGWVASSVCVKT